MRITTEKLLELAQNEAERRTAVVSGYVIGSVAGGDPVFGGTADVDLVLIHEYQPATEREIVPLSDEVHLDIVHHAKRVYDQPRELRVDPWLGPAMCEPVFLHDPTHFFEWAQASVRGQFHRADYVLARGSAFLARARDSLRSLEAGSGWIKAYLRALLETANAVASLDGFPASGRRVMPQLKSKLTSVGHPDVYERFMELLGALEVNTEQWLVDWQADFDVAHERSRDPKLSDVRRDYYLSGYHSMIESEAEPEILWPLLSTWDYAMRWLPEPTPAWERVLDALGLSIEDAEKRKADLEDLMDQVEGVLESWAEKAGA